MPEAPELHKLFKGILDNSSATDTEDEITSQTTPRERAKCKIGRNWQINSFGSSSTQEGQPLKEIEMTNKREYQDIPPDAVDVIGKPKKKVKITDLDKYEAVMRGGKHSPNPNDRNKVVIHKYDHIMEIEREGHHRQEGNMSVKITGQTGVHANFVQPHVISQYHHKARDGNIHDNCDTPPKSPASRSIFKHSFNNIPHIENNSNEDMDTIREGSEPEDNNANDNAMQTFDNHLVPNSSTKTTMSRPSSEDGLLSQLTLNVKKDKDIIDKIEEAMEFGHNDSALSDLQKLGKMIISKPRAFRGLDNQPRSQPRLNAGYDPKDDVGPIPQNNIRYPKYSSSLPVREGTVNWWSNTLGKGQITERYTNEIRTIDWQQLKPHYGALHTGVSVMYQWEQGTFRKFWVQQGMPCVL